MYTRLLAMHITDPAAYARYRAAMMPLLLEHGGGFAYDVEVQDVEGDFKHPVNRIFAIHFPDKAASQAFFGDARYVAVRGKHFEGAVGRFSYLATYSSTP